MFHLYILIHRTILSAFPTAISLSSIIRELPQNYNNYIEVPSGTTVSKRGRWGRGGDGDVIEILTFGAKEKTKAPHAPITNFSMSLTFLISKGEKGRPSIVQ